MDIKRRLYFVLIAIFCVVTWGSIGYYLIFKGQPRFVDCLYMTIISLTTVGYGEVIQISGNLSAEIFTMVLITFGMGIILYGISTLTALFIEGELSGFLRKKRMEKQIQELENHYIICGGGETGLPLISELVKNREQVVLIEQDQENIERCKSIENLLYIQGDATEDENLIAAGIQTAAGIIICLPSDKDSLYVTMTARMLNEKIRIISRLSNQKLRPKLIKAGADSVVSPNTIGALRMASEMIRPTVVNFLDSMLRSSQGNLRIHQIKINGNSSYVGIKLEDIGLQKKFNLLILGARIGKEEILFNPGNAFIIQANTILIVMGEMDNIAKAKKMF